MPSHLLKPAVIGLGYVGLPLLTKISEKYNVYGFDINEDRLVELREGRDSTGELTDGELKRLKEVNLTSNPTDLIHCNIYIVTVPTPVTLENIPDFSFLESASNSVGLVLRPDDIVVYESTVYPGATEEICVPILEQSSGLVFNKDFFVGYSPERINPGDKKHRVSDVVKVTSGSSIESAKLINKFYSSVIDAGTYLASSIRVAEAAKVIENTQRDVNIALINELSRIFSNLGLDTNEVLDAACSKWNFLNFRPGLVGGHCIGVDPYYLLHKASSLGLHPEIISAARRINDGMTEKVVRDFMELYVKKSIPSASNKVLILGATFKENCPDVRNSRVFDFIAEFGRYGLDVDIYDPIAKYDNEIKKYYDHIITELKSSDYLGIILAVAHNDFVALGADKIRSFASKNAIFFDLKGCFKVNQSDLRM